MKRPINERIEDGILLLSIVVSYINQNNLSKMTQQEFDNMSDLEYASRGWPNQYYSYECTRNQYLDIEKQARSFKGKFYRLKTIDPTNGNIISIPDSSRYLVLDIRGDRQSNTEQRVRLKFSTPKDGDTVGILSIDFDEGSGFLKNKTYGNQIQQFLSQI